jgi:hypothetical protein
MSEPNPPGAEAATDLTSQPDDNLQFEQAEYATPAKAHTGPSCSVCKRPIADVYFEAAGRVFCTDCRDRVEAKIRGGSLMARVLKALVFGTAATIVAAGLYHVFVRMTNSDWSLLSILVGFFVGRAVRLGAGNRGGVPFQLLAVFLTYSAIAAMNAPFAIEGFLKVREERKQADSNSAVNVAAEKAKTQDMPKAAGATGKKAGAPAVAGPAESTKAANVPAPGPAVATKPEPARDAAQQPRDPARPTPSLGQAILGLAVLVGFLYALPVFLAFHAPISGLIWAFGLWAAWTGSKAPRLSFNGPFRVGIGRAGA